MDAEVVVIGGGIAGLSAAYRLARNGEAVTVVDAGHEGQATAAGAGIISHAAHRDLPAPYVALFRAATQHYRPFVELLAADGEEDLGYGVVGELVVAPGEDAGARLAGIAARLSAENERWPDRPLGDVELLSPDEARQLFPPLGEDLAAVWTSAVARVDGRLLRDALRRATTRHGGRVVHGTASLRQAGPGSPPRVEVDGDVLGASCVILAGGAWTRPLLEPLGVDLPVVPQRGQIAHLVLPGTATGEYPVLGGYGHDYMVAFPPDKVVVGATRETDSGFDYRVTAGGVAGILSRALAVAPGLASATLEQVRVGFRPASPDGMPLLGAVPGFAELFVATGFGPSGLTLAPFCGDVVAEMATGKCPPHQVGPPPRGELLEAFSPARFLAPAPAGGA